MNTELSPEEISTLESLLSKLTPGALPFKVFHAITRVTATPILEVVPLRESSEGEVEILLLRRPADDPVWPDKLHVPGTVVRASDVKGDFSEAFGRVLVEELKNVTSRPPVFVKNIIHHSGRGMEVSQIYWVEVDGAPAAGEFYPADHLPAELVESQLDFIPAAVEHYKNNTDAHAHN